MTIRVVARAVARPECREALRSALEAVLAPTRREPGCLRYELCQSTTEVDEFAVLEEWRSEADIAAHMATPHVQGLFAALPPLLATPPEIRSYRVLA